ncbi:exodeoxyribonuclease VII large subunit [soil metagenome]
MPSQVMGVALISAYLKQLLESDDLLGDCWIEGEISEYFQSRQGHIYFTLVEENATLKCVLFRGNAARQRSRFGNGDQVVVHGHFSIYEQQGRYQLYADSVQPAGLGLAALEFERLRQKLEEEGLFDVSRKRAIPTIPKRIGVVTSADGAVWHDIQRVLERRFPLTELLLSPATVQGATAPKSIVTALNALIAFGECDTIIVGRGGGSADDLAAFNAEAVARAIFASPVPIISAVGHETDWSLADLVADLRAPTPSAAAELASPSMIDLLEDIANARDRMSTTVSRTFEFRQHQLLGLTRRLAQRSPALQIERIRGELVMMRRALSVAAESTVRSHRLLTTNLRDRARRGWEQSLRAKTWETALRSTASQSLNPAAVLSRGFALVSDEESGQVLQSVHDTEPGRTARISMADGYLLTDIREQVAAPINPESNPS